MRTEIESATPTALAERVRHRVCAAYGKTPTITPTPSGAVKLDMCCEEFRKAILRELASA